MTTRAYLERLLLLNWKGMFFQPFELHQAVTALEGENGAGKTTVMIAAFIVLLPDPQRLVFRNVGEGPGSDDGDRGIYGRLGERGPSYSLLDLRASDGSRVVAGVCLLRGARPRIEFKRFVVESLADEVDLDELVLLREGENERIPDMSELREAFARAGATVKTHDSVGRYCGHLHDLGVLPMRMEQPQERQRFHQMLHTSMYGGFSRSLQTGLRDYLLNEDPRLRSHVARMRENLDACRTTRQQIAHAEERYRLIADVFRFGWGMVEAAFHGTRLFAETRRESATQARERHRRRRRAEQEAILSHRDLVRRHDESKQAVERLRQADEEAANLLERCRTARRLRQELDALIPDREEQARARDEAGQRRDQALASVGFAREALAREQRERDELAHNLADAEQAFESIARKVGQYHAARRSLEDTRTALPDRQIEVEGVEALREESDGQWKTALQDKASSQQALESAEARRRRFDDLLAVLARLAGSEVPETEAADMARLLEAEYRDLEDRVARARDLPQRVEQADRRARRQAATRERLRALEAVCGALSNATAVKAAYADQTRRRQGLEEQRSELKDRCGEHRSAIALAAERVSTLEGELQRWQWAHRLADELAQGFDQPLESAGDLSTLRTQLRERDQDLSRDIEQTGTERKRRMREAERLEFGGGHLDESLVGLADRLDGRLLSELYDDVPAEEAARTEALLGPLHAAMLVPDVALAASEAAREARRPDHLWLLAAADVSALPSGQTLEDSELVRMGATWRLSRHPRHPVVGRVAREREVARLRTEARALESQLDELRAKRESLGRGLKQADELAGESRRLGLPSPEPELRRQRAEQADRRARLRADEASLQHLEQGLTTANATCDTLQACLPDAHLLDEEDWALTSRRLKQEREAILAAKARLQREQADIATLREGFLDLQQPPPDTAHLDGLRRRQKAAEGLLEYWAQARHLLHDLAERLPHFSYADQVELLEEQKGALAQLKSNLNAYAERVARLEGKREEAEAALEIARGAYNDADAELKATLAHMAGLERQLVATGEDGSADSLAAAERLRADTRRELAEADRMERDLNTGVAVAKNQVEQAGKDRLTAREDWRKALVELRPNWRNWIALRRHATELGVLERLAEAAADYAGMGTPNVMERASERRGELGQALRNADGGVELLERLDQDRRGEGAEGSAGLRELRVWRHVRAFLEQSIPRDIVQSDDPEKALEQIGEHLTLLRDRLQDQEQDLRHKAEDVSQSIQVKIRREEARINHLNKGLGRVRFGSIRGVKIHMERHDAMQKLLEAMRTQPDLFSQDQPLEELMASVYRHVGGGQVEGGRLLDYRQYVRLSVRVQRRWCRRVDRHSRRLGATGGLAQGAQGRSRLAIPVPRRGQPAESRLSRHPDRVLRADAGTAAGRCAGGGPGTARTHLPSGAARRCRRQRRGRGAGAAHAGSAPVSRIDWSRPELHWVLLRILETGEVQRSQGNADLVDWLQELGWLRQGSRRQRFVLNPARRTAMEERLDRVWPAWRETLIDLDRAGLPHDETGARTLHRRSLPLAPLPPRLHQKTWMARFGAHSKASSPDLPAPDNLTLTQDDILRIRPNRGLLLAMGGQGTLDCDSWASRFGELVIPQRAMDNNLAVHGQTPRWVMTVENLGAYIDLPAPENALIVHQPGWNSRLALRFIATLPRSLPWWHFGDLDPEGLDIYAALSDGSRRPRLFLPPWWRDYLDSHGLPLAEGWPDPRSAVEEALITELRTKRRWLEQEAILLDPRLTFALAWLENERLDSE